jgi:hypothetical protein
VRFTLDLVQRRAALTLEPQPLDDFWADLTGRSSQYREVDGPVLAQSDLLTGRDDSPYDDVALTHRIRRFDDESVHVFVLDGVAQASARVAELG